MIDDDGDDTSIDTDFILFLWRKSLPLFISFASSSLLVFCPFCPLRKIVVRYFINRLLVDDHGNDGDDTNMCADFLLILWAHAPSSLHFPCFSLSPLIHIPSLSWNGRFFQYNLSVMWAIWPCGVHADGSAIKTHFVHFQQKTSLSSDENSFKYNLYRGLTQFSV